MHLKSTDTKLADTGNSIRAAGAEALVRWLDIDREAGSELDYLILSDYNAETAQQGLSPFTSNENLRLLSVGMQDRYGRAEALTGSPPSASSITSSSQPKLPPPCRPRTRPSS